MPSFVRGFLLGAILTIACFNFVDILRYWFVFWVFIALVFVPRDKFKKASKSQNRSMPKYIKFL